MTYLISILSFLALQFSGARPPQDPIDKLAEWARGIEARMEAVEGSNAALELEVALLGERVEVLEAGGGTPPRPPDGVWPEVQEVSVALRLRGARAGEIGLPPPTEWEVGERSRHATTWGTLSDLHIRAFWDQTLRGDSWVSVQVVNAYADVGVVELAGARVQVDGESIADWGRVTLSPRLALPWATTWPATADAWDWTGDERPFPAWSEPRAKEDIADRDRNVLLGVWPYWWYDQAPDGARVPRSPGSPAGYGVAPFDGGDGDYLTGPWGKAQRWAWFLGETWRAFWFLDRETGQPELRTGIEYWTGRENQRWKELALPGYGYSPQGARQEAVEDHTRAEDGPHFRRTWGGAASVAPWCGPARWVMRMAAYDVMQDWNLDPREGRDGDLLLGGLTRRIAQATNGSLVPPKPSGIFASRYLAQAIFTLVEARSSIDPELFDRRARAFIKFGQLVTSPDGVSNRDSSGDAEQYAKPPWNLRPPVCSAFHQRLVCGAYRALGDAGYDEAEALADRMAGFLGPDPTPYAIEAWQLGAPRDRWQARKHSAAAALSAAERRWSPDGGRYAAFTHRILPAQWPTLEDFDAAARQGGLEENWYAVVPREVWEPLWDRGR